jgi:hypothetical protein
VNRLIANTFILFGRVMDFRCVAINLEIFWYQARIEEPIDIRVRIINQPGTGEVIDFRLNSLRFK